MDTRALSFSVQASCVMLGFNRFGLVANTLAYSPSIISLKLNYNIHTKSDSLIDFRAQSYKTIYIHNLPMFAIS
jgi:hypothetical protein